MEPVELATTVEDSKLKVPEDFSFPFTAYEIQKDFMKALFVALDERKLGIFESPTGTVRLQIPMAALFGYYYACVQVTNFAFLIVFIYLCRVNL